MAMSFNLSEKDLCDGLTKGLLTGIEHTLRKDLQARANAEIENIIKEVLTHLKGGVKEVYRDPYLNDIKFHVQLNGKNVGEV